MKARDYSKPSTYGAGLIGSGSVLGVVGALVLSQHPATASLAPLSRFQVLVSDLERIYCIS